MSHFAVFCLCCIPAIFIFIKWAYKYNNPYKLFFVVGKKGSGKTSYLCKLALDYIKQGYIVYTNVSDLLIPGVRIIDNITSLGDFVPVRDSVLLLDEVSLVWDNRHFKDFKDCTKEFFRLQRHYRCVVYLFSQTFDVDKKIRDLADRMYLCTQFCGRWSLLREINKKIIITESTSEAESRVAENLSFCGIFSWRFIYIPKYQPYFDSFVLPVHPELSYEEVPFMPVPVDVGERRAPRIKRCAARLLPMLLYAYGKLLSVLFWFMVRPVHFHFLFKRKHHDEPVRSETYSSIDDFWKM